jgi:hypothetical protein
MKLTGKYRILVTGDIDKLGVGYEHKSIGYLFGRLFSGEEAVMENLANLGITVELLDDA